MITGPKQANCLVFIMTCNELFSTLRRKKTLLQLDSFRSIQLLSCTYLQQSKFCWIIVLLLIPDDSTWQYGSVGQVGHWNQLEFIFNITLHVETSVINHIWSERQLLLVPLCLLFFHALSEKTTTVSAMILTGWQNQLWPFNVHFLWHFTGYFHEGKNDTEGEMINFFLQSYRGMI